MKAKGAWLILEMLRLHGVRHVFGLPGETTLGFYRQWLNYNEIEHILTHDERAAAYMAEAYAKVTGTVGVSEAPAPGAAHPAPGVLESNAGGVPTICFTSDIPYNCDKRNMLTGFDHNAMYKAITKESILITAARDIPFLMRRAFRVALADKPGAVHIRVPMNVYDEEVEVTDLYPDPCLARWPAYRPVADFAQIDRAIELLAEAERPVVVCGQGALVSGAGEEVLALAEHFGVPVGCTMTGKGTIPETHPLSIRLVGARGGTGYANRFLEEADFVFFVGSNTDSAGTDAWKLPPHKDGPKVAYLNISGVDAGNNYRTEAALVGDAKATLAVMVERAKSRGVTGRAKNRDRVVPAMAELDAMVARAAESEEAPVNPVRFMKALEAVLPERSYIAVEPGMGSIFSAAFIVQKDMGRRFLSNYTCGALGYVIPALVGVGVAHPEAVAVGLGGDGSFHFNCGELETYARLGLNAKLFIFNNDVFGWIKGETAHVYDADFFATDFGRVDYAAVARGFGIKGYRIERADEVRGVLEEAFSFRGPALIEVRLSDQSRVVPPVPRWIASAEAKGLPHYY